MGVRTAKSLNTPTLATLTKPGLYADGVGPNLQVGKTGARSWIFRYRLPEGGQAASASRCRRPWASSSPSQTGR